MSSSGSAKARKRPNKKNSKTRLNGNGNNTNGINGGDDSKMPASMRSPRQAQGMTSTLEGTPVIPRFSHVPDPDDDDYADGRDDVQLLSEDERRRAAVGVHAGVDELGGQRSKRPLSGRDKRAMGLLILLCEWLSWSKCDQE
jgi:hypothetical protein